MDNNNTTSPIYHFKILVPAAAAGRIIGKGGTTIAQLQKDAGARVKMSKASEFYPGTTERVCLISGPIEGILKINDFFMENFSSTSIKILVPNSTAGMIIGKGGSYIKQIKEESGTYVQISQKCTDLSLPERCVTIVGEIENIRKASAMILSKIVEDVGSAYRDIRTSSITTSMFSQSTTTSPSSSSTSSSSTTASNNNINHNHLHNSNNNHNHHHHQQQQLHQQQQQYQFNNNLNNNNLPNAATPTSTITSQFISNNINNNTINNNNLVKSLSPDHLGCSASLSPSCATSAFMATSPSLSNIMPPSISSDMNSAQIIESIKLVLRVSGYGEDAVSEITSAMSTLASYGVLGVGLGLL